MNRYPLYHPAVGSDPDACYSQMFRESGEVVPVDVVEGLPGWLVLTWDAAREVVTDTATYSRDGRVWQQQLPEDHPVLGMIGHRPNALFSDGEEHRRLRQVITDVLTRVDPEQLRLLSERVADRLIADFAHRGEADLIGSYARLMPLHVFNALFGMGPEHAPDLVGALAALMEGRSAEGNRLFEAYMGALLAAKADAPAQDVASWMLGHHAELSPEEVVHQLVLTIGAGQEPTTALIGNTLSRLLDQDAYRAAWTDGAVTTTAAVEEVLRAEPPMANYAPHWPRTDTVLRGVRIPAHSLVLVSLAAASSGHATSGGSGAGSRAHLAWSAGPHACPAPAQRMAIVMTTTAIERLIARLPDLAAQLPRDQLTWRPGAFQRALAALPVTFTPIPTDSGGSA